MKAGKGFTFVELIIVIAVIGIVLAMTVPMGARWISDYKFSATSRAMVNAANLVRMNAIGGPITINIKQIDKGATNTEFVLIAADNTTTADDIVYTTPPYNTTFGFPEGGTATNYFPIQRDDYVTLVGFRNPGYVNGALFRVTFTSYGAPTQVVGSTTQWTMPEFSFKCESCSEVTPTSCMQWVDAAGSYTSDTGKVQVAASLKISPVLTKVATLDKVTDATKIAGSYAIGKSGNSVNLRYWRGGGSTADTRGAYDIKVNGTDIPSGTVKPIVFDYAGATRGHIEYKIEINQIKSDGTVDTRRAPIVFTILPSGRIRLGAFKAS